MNALGAPKRLFQLIENVILYDDMGFQPEK